MRTSLKTLRKHLPFIENSFIYPYDNGRIEGNNNKINVLNRVAYGNRNFQNYRKRILLHFKLKPSIKQQKKDNPMLYNIYVDFIGLKFICLFLYPLQVQ
ncbi:transposase [Psychrobacillus antarcticus]|uniref:transposase n=1 Tax=Psychrobacillus antarcticus TaxID=2879115 RepID=UPI002408816B|nr:transposase [Psychrobacillus antarcticus]